MRITVTKPKPKSSSAEVGDIKINSKGKFIRLRAMFNNCYVVSNGKPSYFWKWFADAPNHKGKQVIDYCGMTKESLAIKAELIKSGQL